MQNLEKKSYPSDNQIREFWEWCGFHFQKLEELKPQYRHEGNLRWVFSSGEIGGLPPIDLNNLFKYAVPKLRQVNLVYLGQQFHAEVWKGISYGKEAGFDPTLALFWAIWEVTNAK